MNGHFEAWWKEEGQFVCASGQQSHKEVIHSAFLAGYYHALTINENALRRIEKLEESQRAIGSELSQHLNE